MSINKRVRYVESERAISDGELPDNTEWKIDETSLVENRGSVDGKSSAALYLYQSKANDGKYKNDSDDVR